MKYLTLLLVFFLSPTWANSFFPNNFSFDFTEVIKSQITKEVTQSEGRLRYQKPNLLRIEKPSEFTFVSNGKKEWFYTFPFISEEPGEVKVRAADKSLHSRLFEILDQGLITNKMYQIEKLAQSYLMTFSLDLQKELEIEKVELGFEKIKTPKPEGMREMKLFFKDGRQVLLKIKSFNSAPTFTKEEFNFNIPPNTQVIEQ